MKYIVSKKNGVHYMKQPFFRYCGQCQITTLLQWLGKQDASVHFKKNSPSWLAKISGFMFPRGFEKVFARYNLLTENRRVKEKEKLLWLKEMIYDTKKPLIILIAHGYDRKGKQRDIWRMITMQHYISIWGFDDEKEIFYIYDSTITGGENILPIGNFTLSYDDFLYYWKWSIRGIYNYHYISLKEE